MEKSGALYRTHVEFYTIAMVILTVIIHVKCHHAIINFQHHRHGGILRGDWGQNHHSLLNHIYEGSEGCLKLLHCELRNAMALYFVTAISHYPPFLM